MEELGRLADTAGARVVFEFTQHRPAVDPKYFVGEGKAKEIAAFCQREKINLVIFNDELSGTQQRNLEDIIGVKIIDRTRLILDIFRQRARTSEGKLQVELAQLEYLLPRLTGKGIFLSRQIGGIGYRGGPGEMKLEVDRRRIKDRISALKGNLNKVKEHRSLQRKRRKEKELPFVALVGYTNSGKSTLLNALTDAGVFVEDKLFATLDPTIRRFILPNNQPVLFGDTVGFIRKLPHHIIAAFRATLEEVTEADLLLQVIDISNKERKKHIENVHKVLAELAADDKPMINVFNKIDLTIDKRQIAYELKRNRNAVAISALKKTGLEDLLGKLMEFLSLRRTKINLSFPYDRQDLVSLVFEKGRVLETRYAPKKIYIKAELDRKTARQLDEFVRKTSVKLIKK
ncbi:MAG: GTPase HflX, partial [bacterium]